MKTQGRIFSLVPSLIFAFLFIIISEISETQAAKFIRNSKTQTCLQYLVNSTQTCMPLTFASCQNFGNSSDSTKWNLISVNPSQPLSSSSEIFIESFDDKFCLTTTKSNSGVEACPCVNDDVNQKWKFNTDGSFSSSSNNGKCLTMINDDDVSLDTCQSNSTPMTWRINNVAPNTINVYVDTLFRGNFSRLTVNSYTSKDLPKEIFSSPFSLEIPPSLMFVIGSGNDDKNSIIYSSDIAQVDAITSLSSTIAVKLASDKPKTDSDDDDDGDDNSAKGLKSWHIFLIVIIILLSLLIIIIIVALLIRKSNVKKRQKKIDNFKETYDENKVQKQMRNLYDIAPRLVKNNSYKISPLKELEPTYSSKQHAQFNRIHNNYNNNDSDNDDNEDNDAFFKRQKLRRSSTMGSVNRKARCYFENNNNIEDFEIVVADKGIKASPRTIVNEDFHTGGNDLY